MLGLGLSGLATAAALRAGGAIPVCWDENPDARDNATGFEVADLGRTKNWDGITGLIIEPEIAHLFPSAHPAVQLAWEKEVPVDNDISLFFQSFAQPEWSMFDHEPKVVCITGDKNKITAAGLICQILEFANRPCQTGGAAVLGLEPLVDNEVLVLELSSHQLELARILAPDLSVMLDVSSGQTARHGGAGGCFAAQSRLFTACAPDRAVIGVDHLEGQYLVNRLLQSGTPVIQIASRKLSGQGWHVFLKKGFLAEWRKARQVASVDLRSIARLAGPRDQENACAAFAVCRSLGLAPKVIEAGLRAT